MRIQTCLGRITMQNDQNSRKVHRVGARSDSKASSSAEGEQQTVIKQAGGRGRQKKKMSKTARIVLFVVLGLLLIGGGLLAKFYIDISNPQSLFQEEETSTPAPTPVQSTVPGGAITPSPTPTVDPQQQLMSQADLEMMNKDRVNILVMGIDESTERANWGSFRTDTMILVTINFKTNDVDLISVPRDSYVKICNADGKVINENGLPKFNKINSAFSTGGGAQKSGFEYAMGTVEYLFGGINIDYYIGFNMNVVKQVVDAMGGVDYNVDIEVTMNGRSLHPGEQHLDGQAVLDYCRQRHGSSDIARVDRQQRMLFAIFNQLKSTGQIVNIPQIYQAVEQNIQTNLSFKQISSLALLATQMNQDQLGRHTVDGEFLNMDNISYWGLHATKLKSLIKEVFGVTVNVDADVDAANARAQYEATRALVEPELTAAQKSIDAANAILTKYGANLTENAKEKMNAAINLLDQAIEAGEKDLLIQYTANLNELSAEYLAQLQAHGLANEQSGSSDSQSDIPEETPAG